MFELSKTIEKLPVQAQKELNDFVILLVNKYSHKNNTNSFKFDWVGDLKELGSKNSSVQLQHSILDMWN